VTIKIEGIIPAMVTPLNADEQVDEQALRHIINFLIGGGIHGLLVHGSQGEFYGASPREKRRVWEIVVDEVNGRVPIYAGTGAVTTREVLALNRIAEETGIDLVSVLTPFFVSPSQEELFQHFSAIADATSLPVVLYNNPARTGVSLSASLVACLAEHPNIVGIKDSSGDLSLTCDMIRQTSQDFKVLMGRDSLIYAGLHHGCAGAIAATANVVPTLVVEIYKAFQAGDQERSLAAQEKLARLRQSFGLGSFPVVVKEAMNMIGLPAGPPHRPIRALDGDARTKLMSVLREVGAIPTQP
jgi:4-hydroxy-tetrahydrodipicolinate synthase